MFFEGKATTDRGFIKAWVEARNGCPAIARKISDASIVEILQIEFPDGEGGTQLEKITWEEFFKRFEKDQLVFLYQEQIGNGSLSRSVNFI